MRFNLVESLKRTPDSNILLNEAVSNELDREYFELLKDYKKNYRKLNQMVQNEAKKNGYTVTAYHGTYGFGRTKFDLYDVLFLTDSIGVAGNFSGGSGKRDVYVKRSASDMPSDELIDWVCDNTWAEVRYAKDDDFEKEKEIWKPLTKSQLKYYGLSSDANEKNAKKLNYIDGLYNKFKSGDDIYFCNGNTISNVYPNCPFVTYDELVDFADSYMRKSEINVKNGGVYKLYIKTDNMLEVDAKGEYYTNIPLSKELEKYATDSEIKRGLVTSDQLVVIAHDAGYKTLKIKDVVEGGDYGNAGMSDVYVIISAPENVKSADIVTVSDDGDIIPLSQRFNSNSDDIREDMLEVENPDTLSIPYRKKINKRHKTEVKQ